MNINNPTTFSTPALTLSTSNSSGTAGALRADDTLLVYDTTLPDAITYGQSGAIGSAATSARRDHSHGMAASEAISAATQAEMEAHTSTTVFVSPARAQFHPGVCKVWVTWEQSGPHGMDASYNMTSVTDGGAAGDSDHLFNVDFAGTDLYAPVFGGARDETPGVSGGKATTGLTTITYNTSNTAQDSTENFMAIFGDQ